MQVQYITNACFYFTMSDGLTVLSDPWMSDGIYHGIIFNYPRIPAELKSRYLALRPDFIYLSHMHSDHFDAVTLSHFDKLTPILIGRFPNAAMFQAVKSLGFQNIQELEFGETKRLGQHQIRIYPQFSGSSDDVANESGLDMDTSLFIQDANGKKCFFAVDNPMQERHAEMLHLEHGSIDLAILPYTGASIYPFCYKNYSEEEKRQRMLKLRQAKLDKFVQLSKAIGALRVVPAAGSFVHGGKGASYASFQPQPTPSQIASHWKDHGMDMLQLCLLSTGDRVNLGDFSVSIESLTLELDRNYTEEDRTRYAQSLAEFPCDLDLIHWPDKLRIPWKRLITKARANMWDYQQKSACKPEVDVYLVVSSSSQVPLPLGADMRIKISMDEEQIDLIGSIPNNKGRQYVEHFLSSQVLIALILGTTYWNVAEYHMQQYRNPDKFDPTVRSLLAFFKL